VAPAGGARPNFVIYFLKADSPSAEEPVLSPLPSDSERFAVYSSSDGDAFSLEVRSLLGAALKELGHRVLIGDEKTGFYAAADRHVIVAPQEFFYRGRGLLLGRGRIPAGPILYLTDPSESERFPLSERWFPKAGALWSVCAGTAARLLASGHACSHVPPGFVAGASLFRSIKRLPRTALTEHLGPAVRGPGAAGSRLARRPLEFLFEGSNSSRRARFFSRNSAELSRFKGVLSLDGDLAPSRVSTGLAQRARIVLSIHPKQGRRFDWEHAVLKGIAQGAFLVSEPVSACAPFVPGRDFAEVPLADIPGALEHHLRSSEGRREAQRIAERGRGTFVSECRMSVSVKRALEEAGGGPPDPKLIRPVIEIRGGSAAVDILASGGSRGARPSTTAAVTLFEYRRHVRTCLDSLAAQTLVALDLVVVDDRSSDRSASSALAWLRRRGRRFRSWRLARSRKNSGPALARNACFSLARTPLVFVLDADNIAHPPCIERLGKALHGSGAEFAYSYLSLFGDEEGLKNTASWSRDFLWSGYSLDALSLVRKKVWRELGGYRCLGGMGREDFDLWLRLARRGGRGVLVPEVLAAYRTHLDSMDHRRAEANAGRLEGFFSDEFGVDFSPKGRREAALAVSMFGGRRAVAVPRRGQGPREARGRSLAGALGLIGDIAAGGKLGESR